MQRPSPACAPLTDGLTLMCFAEEPSPLELGADSAVVSFSPAAWTVGLIGDHYCQPLDA